MKKKFLISCFSIAATLSMSLGVAGVAASAQESQTADFYSINGASVKLMDTENEIDYSGIRFLFEMTPAFYNGIVTEGAYNENVEVGAYVIPTSLLGEAEATAENIKANAKAKQETFTVNKWTAQKSETDGTTDVYASYVHLYNVPATQYGTDISTFAYVYDGTNTYETAVQTRSFNTVAKNAVDSGDYTVEQMSAYLPNVDVIFDADGAQTTVPVKYGAKVAAQDAAEKSGYAFNGWTVDGSLFDFNTAIKEETTVSAKYMKLPTSEELQNGYTFSMSDFPQITTQQYASAGSGDYKRNTEFVDRPDFITDTTKFGDKVLKITEIGFCAKFDFTQGLLQEGKKYNVSFNLYAVKTRADNVIVGHTSTADANILQKNWNGSGAENVAKTFSYSLDFTALANDFIYIYMGASGSNGVEMYMSDIKLTEYAELYMPTEEELKAGYTFEMSELLNITTQQWVSAGSGSYKKITDLVDRPAAITDTTKFGDKVLKLTEIGYCAKFDFMQGMLQEGKTYRVAFDLYAVKTRADNVIVGHTSTDAANILKQDWNGSGNENTAKTFSYSVEFIALANDFIYIYMGTSGSNSVEMYLGNITVTQVD